MNARNNGRGKSGQSLRLWSNSYVAHWICFRLIPLWLLHTSLVAEYKIKYHHIGAVTNDLWCNHHYLFTFHGEHPFYEPCLILLWNVWLVTFEAYQCHLKPGNIYCNVFLILNSRLVFLILAFSINCSVWHVTTINLQQCYRDITT